MADVTEELSRLRNIIANIISSLETWATLNDVCQLLDLSAEDNTSGLGKDKYLHKVTSDAIDGSIISAAHHILTSYPGTRGQPSETDLQLIQDALWWIENKGTQRISNVTRYRIAESLEGIKFWGRLSRREFFSSTIPMALKSKDEDGNLVSELSFSQLLTSISGKQSKTEQPSRISVLEYLKAIGLAEWPDERFCLLLERMVHPEVQPSDRQKQLVELFNTLLQQDSHELRQEGAQGGFPVYKIRRKDSGVSGVPKYIIFASTGPKPDIVIEDAVSMDIRVVRYADQCLIYDQPPPYGDLTWQMLVEWWGKMNASDPKDENIRRDFGLRLRASLQSEPERILFDTYFKIFKPKMGSDLPALLPQVYLHYDPRNQNERSKPVLVRQRMDFLLLLRNSSRIVIEIDGVQHYSNGESKASPSKYAEMASEDRRIRLLGYEIYRFGGAEFVDAERASQTITSFFQELFHRHSIKCE
jgi:very-short-patch-repair endonuclease